MKIQNLKINDIATSNDFSDFLSILLKDLKENPEKWENPTLERFLEAMSAWVCNIEGTHFEHQNLTMPENIPWNVFAACFLAAKIYE